MKLRCVTNFVCALALLAPFGAVQAAEPSLDAYEQAVIRLCDQSKPAVVRVKSSESEDITAPEGDVRSNRIRVGTGFFIDPSGELFTSASVVAGAQKIIVEWQGQPFAAKVIGVDRERSNLALLKLTGVPAGLKFPALKLGDSKDLRIGSMVVKIGFPFNMEPSPSVGFVGGTAMYRSTPLLMAQLSINPGESGAPFLNARGDVVGVLFGGSVQQPNVAYALPVQAVKRVTADFRQFGEARYGWLGMGVQQVVVSATNAPPRPAVMIENVSPGAPAAQAGLRPGDIVVAIGPKAVHAPGDVAEAMFYLRVGERPNIQVLRSNQLAQVAMNVVPRSGTPALPAETPAPNATGSAMEPRVIQATPAAAQTLDNR